MEMFCSCLQEVMSTLDLDSIHDIMVQLYEELQRPNLKDDERETLTQVAFGYYHLVRRYQDVNPDFDPKGTSERVIRRQSYKD